MSLCGELDFLPLYPEWGPRKKRCPRAKGIWPGLDDTALLPKALQDTYRILFGKSIFE